MMSKNNFNSVGWRIYVFFKSILHMILLSVFGFSSTCKKNPSCSRYTVMMIKERGTISGLWLGLKRFIECSMGR